MDVVKISSALVVTTYWVIVLVKLGLASKEIGKLPNVVPGELMGLLLRLIWIPVICLWVLTPWFTIHGNDHFLPLDPQWYLPFAGLNMMLSTLFGFVVALFSLGLTLWCWHVMGASWRVGIDPQEKTKLVTSGPFSLVLHPIYSLSLALMVGTLCVFPTPLMLAIAVLHILLLILEAIREERFMFEKYPEEYPSYHAQMGRFIPKWNR